MTQSDKWKKRPAVLKYRAFADEVRLHGVVVQNGDHVTFHVPMPKSWSNSKKEMHDKAPHRQTPDLDNLQKSLLDAVYKDDSFIWDIHATKLWSYEGGITIEEQT